LKVIDPGKNQPFTGIDFNAGKQCKSVECLNEGDGDVMVVGYSLDVRYLKHKKVNDGVNTHNVYVRVSNNALVGFVD